MCKEGPYLGTIVALESSITMGTLFLILGIGRTTSPCSEKKNKLFAEKKIQKKEHAKIECQ